MKILVMKKNDSFIEYKAGRYPAHLLYGMDELSKNAEKIYYHEGGIVKSLFLAIAGKIDIVFFPYLSHFALVFYLIKKICKRHYKIYGWQHKKITLSRFYLLKLLYTRLYDNIDGLFFLSPKNLDESLIELNMAHKNNNFHFIPWYADIKYFDTFKYVRTQNEYFISTGKENRDFDTLISSMCKTKSSLKIFTNEKLDTHGAANIELNVGYFDYNKLLKETVSSYAVVITIQSESINYCVGLSSLVEAMSLGRPLIATYNPYWHIDIEKEGIGILIKNNTIEEWTKAILFLQNNPELANEMGNKAKLLVQEKYNYDVTISTLRRFMTM